VSELVPERPPTPPASIDAGVPGGLDYRAKFAEETHQYVREYIRLADQKATFFFAGGTALLAFLHRGGASDRWLKPLAVWNLLDAITFVSMAALAVSALISIGVVIPRLGGSRRGYIFFNAIAEHDSGTEYSSAITSLSQTDLVRIKLQHCFDISCVCRRKYEVLRAAVWAGVLGLAGSLAYFLFS
jgi:pycsar effector protein